MEDLAFYEGIFHKISWEGGLGEYVHSYESGNTFNRDPELKQTFIAAKKALCAFETMLEQRIESLGGDLDDLEEH